MKAGKFILALIGTAIPVIAAIVIYQFRDGQEPDAAQSGAIDFSNATALIGEKCAGCHEALDSGGWYRISNMRKTPEGWDMTLLRMRLWHDVELTADEQRVIVKYLSDWQGLAPEETAGWRWALEQQPNHPPQSPNPTLGEFCGRCHSFARVALQRRDEEEWRRLAHMHMGQWPSMEHQEKARNYENYWELMRDDVSRDLGQLYPLQSDFWTDWQAEEPADLSGRWSISGERYGKGRYVGSMTITRIADDQYETDYELTYQDGESVSGSGRALVYTGYEWRGASELDGDEISEVFAYDQLFDGFETLIGRWYLDGSDEIGASFAAMREAEAPRIMTVEPPFLRQGEKATVTLYGNDLAGIGYEKDSVSLGQGINIMKILSESENAISVRADVAPDAVPGPRDATIGAEAADAAFRVIENIDYITVEPGQAIARVGSGGGPLPKVKAQFVAIGWLNGPDGLPETGDDIRLGTVDAAWSIANNGPQAEAMHDAEFAGEIDENGLFTPAVAGINEERAKYGRATNNTGDLLVIARVDAGDETLTASAHLIVTLQRWVNPVIR